MTPKTNRTKRYSPTDGQKQGGQWYQNSHGIWHRRKPEDDEPGSILEDSVR